ncbi:hypothetical protein J6590_059676 [Homalodisca vitripennis]|nr:hypothetical protein J6590_059676 [Homalodisca vitripennis]
MPNKLLKNTGVTIGGDLTVKWIRVFKVVAEKFGLWNVWTTNGRNKWITGEDGSRRTVVVRLQIEWSVQQAHSLITERAQTVPLPPSQPILPDTAEIIDNEISPYHKHLKAAHINAMNH